VLNFQCLQRSLSFLSKMQGGQKVLVKKKIDEKTRQKKMYRFLHFILDLDTSYEACCVLPDRKGSYGHCFSVWIACDVSIFGKINGFRYKYT